MSTPDHFDARLTLQMAVARFEDLRLREALYDSTEPTAAPALASDQALELLALGEVIARKVAYGRQLTVRTARSAGASWTQIGAALGTTKQAAWEAHTGWLERQASRSGQRADDGQRPDDPAGRDDDPAGRADA